MANTYSLISSYTVGAGGVATIEFTSIPSTYTDLVVKLSSRGTVSAVTDNLDFQINGVTTSSYTEKLLYGNGSAVGSAGGTNTASLYQHENAANSTSNIFTNTEIYFPNYTSSNNKSIAIENVTENNATESAARLNALLFSNTSTISSIKLYPNSGSFVQYTTAYLYGIKNS